MKELVEHLRELYEQHRVSAKHVDRTFKGGLEGQLKDVEQLPPADLRIETLAEYAGDRLSLSIVLANLPPKVLLEEFGADVLKWTTIHQPCFEEAEVLMQALDEFLGIDKDFFEKARLTNWRMFGKRDTLTILKTYDMLSDMDSGLLDSFDLPSLLQSYAKTGVRVSDKRIADYSLYFLTPVNTSEIGRSRRWNCAEDQDTKKEVVEAFGVYLDAPVGFALVYKDRPQAVMSFVPKNASSLRINQMQGIQGKMVDRKDRIVGRRKSRGLVPLNWKDMMLDITERIADHYGFEELAILSGHNNQWTKPYDGEIHLPIDIALKAYDDYARDRGFVQREDRNWYRHVDTSACLQKKAV